MDKLCYRQKFMSEARMCNKPALQFVLGGSLTLCGRHLLAHNVRVTRRRRQAGTKGSNLVGFHQRHPLEAPIILHQEALWSVW